MGTHSWKHILRLFCCENISVSSHKLSWCSHYTIAILYAMPKTTVIFLTQVSSSNRGLHMDIHPTLHKEVLRARGISGVSHAPNDAWM